MPRPKPEKKPVKLNFKVTEEHRDRLKAIAASQNVTMTAIVEGWIENAEMPRKTA